MYDDPEFGKRYPNKRSGFMWIIKVAIQLAALVIGISITVLSGVTTVGTLKIILFISGIFVAVSGFLTSSFTLGKYAKSKWDKHVIEKKFKSARQNRISYELGTNLDEEMSLFKPYRDNQQKRVVQKQEGDEESTDGREENIGINYKGVKKSIDKFIKEHPDDSHMFSARAEANYFLGNFKEAKLDINQFLLLNGSDSNINRDVKFILHFKANVYRAIGDNRQDYKEKLFYYHKAKEIYEQINDSKGILTVIHPKDPKEFKRQLNNWKHEHDMNGILFIFEPKLKLWNAYLIKNEKKEVIKKSIVRGDSPFNKELNTINQENSLSYNKSSLETLLRRITLFEGHVHEERDPILLKDWGRTLNSIGDCLNEVFKETYYFHAEALLKEALDVLVDYITIKPPLTNKEEFKKQLGDWRRTQKSDSILFIFDPELKEWKAFLTRNAIRKAASQNRIKRYFWKIIFWCFGGLKEENALVKPGFVAELGGSCDKASLHKLLKAQTLFKDHHICSEINKQDELRQFCLNNLIFVTANLADRLDNYEQAITKYERSLSYYVGSEDNFPSYLGLKFYQNRALVHFKMAIRAEKKGDDEKSPTSKPEYYGYSLILMPTGAIILASSIPEKNILLENNGRQIIAHLIKNGKIERIELHLERKELKDLPFPSNGQNYKMERVGNEYLVDKITLLCSCIKYYNFANEHYKNAIDDYTKIISKISPTPNHDSIPDSVSIYDFSNKQKALFYYYLSFYQLYRVHLLKKLEKLENDKYKSEIGKLLDSIESNIKNSEDIAKTSKLQKDSINIRCMQLQIRLHIEKNQFKDAINEANKAIKELTDDPSKGYIYADYAEALHLELKRFPLLEGVNLKINKDQVRVIFMNVNDANQFIQKLTEMKIKASISPHNSNTIQYFVTLTKEEYKKLNQERDKALEFIMYLLETAKKYEELDIYLQRKIHDIEANIKNNSYQDSIVVTPFPVSRPTLRAQQKHEDRIPSASSSFLQEAVKTWKRNEDTKYPHQEHKSDQADKLNGLIRPMGFRLQNVLGNGRCFFYAVLHQLQNGNLHNQYSNWNEEKLRMSAVQYIVDHQNEFEEFIPDGVNSFLNGLIEGKRWADDVSITALSKALNINMIIINSDNSKPIVKEQSNAVGTVYLGYEVEWHYQSLIHDPGSSLRLEQSMQKIQDYLNDFDATIKVKHSKKTGPGFFEGEGRSTRQNSKPNQNEKEIDTDLPPPLEDINKPNVT